jgi:hypothetical protein
MDWRGLPENFAFDGADIDGTLAGFGPSSQTDFRVSECPMGDQVKQVTAPISSEGTGSGCFGFINYWSEVGCYRSNAVYCST